MNTPEWIWLDGELVPWAEATVHVTTHALHYGSSVFEGIRAYETREGVALFRLRDHLVRMQQSAKLLRMPMPFSVDRLEQACRKLVRSNHDGACYVRPLAFRGSGDLCVDGRERPTQTTIISFEWGAYLGDGAVEHGVDAAVSSWRRFSSNTHLPLGKIGGQYVNNQLVAAQAHVDGYQEGIVLDESGLVAEGSGENLFAVKDGVLLTPPVFSAILAGITRSTVLQLAGDLGIPCHETPISRDALYLADELFMTGTAAEITPVRSVDRIPIGRGERGPVTARLQDAFFSVLRGETADRHGWLTPIDQSAPATAYAAAAS